MNRHIGAFAAALLLASPTLAHAQRGPASSPRYADGTGNNVIDQLNASQLNGNFKGPYYNRGEQPPPFRAVHVEPPPPPPPPPPVHRRRFHPRPHPVPPGPPGNVMQPGGPR